MTDPWQTTPPSSDQETQPGAGVDTPDPFGDANATDYGPGANSGPDFQVDYQPPWPLTRAPGTVRTIAAGAIVPLNPWAPELALLNSEQMAVLNRESAARQAASYYVDSPRDV